jgi:hypothetical protein
MSPTTVQREHIVAFMSPTVQREHIVAFIWAQQQCKGNTLLHLYESNNEHIYIADSHNNREGKYCYVYMTKMFTRTRLNINLFMTFVC